MPPRRGEDALVGYGLLPLLFPAAQDRLMSWSNVIRLVALVLLMVGQNVLGRTAVKQARETHDAVIEELALLRAERDQLATNTTALIPTPSPTGGAS